MTPLWWTDRPAGDRPVMIVAFEGWNDAADAATSAVDYLAEHLQAREFAQIDPEEFYDFTATRPRVRSLGGLDRTIDWPRNTFSWATPQDAPGGIVLMRGVEPQLKWRGFCRQVLQVAAELNCSMVITLGSLLADVARDQPPYSVTHTYSPSSTDSIWIRLTMKAQLALWECSIPNVSAHRLTRPLSGQQSPPMSPLHPHPRLR